MKLKSVEISEFQSIRNSNPFEVGDITCLVGKNEAGKTAVLQALYRLNPIIHSEGAYDVTDDYPRADVEDYQQDVERKVRTPAIVARATFALENADIDQITEGMGNGFLRVPELTLSKGYENVLRIALQIDESVANRTFIERAQVPEALAQSLLKNKSLEDLEKAIEANKDESVTEHLARLKQSFAEIKAARGIVMYVYEKYLKKSVPKFLYFDEYYMMNGHANIETLKQRVDSNQLQKSDHPLLGLIALARLQINDLIAPAKTEWLINKLEGAGNHLSKKVLKYWSQNKHVQMKFDVRPGRPGDPTGMTTGTNLWARIYDSKHLVTTPLGTRSRGFVWFFSFLAWFDQQQRNQEPLILLLDEPGLFLHGKAQADLLRYMEEELRGNHQVVYSTHSPFMVDPRRFDRVRIVQDLSMDTDDPLSLDQEGTKVLSEVLDATDDSLFPLQGALGYEIHQTLFVGPNSLVVEGVSDLLFIQSLSGILQKMNREGLSSTWTITPVGGAEKVPTFVALLGAQRGLTIATLIDIQKKDAQLVENLYKRKLLQKKHVLTYADFIGKKEADVEDMFEEAFYLDLVNAEFARDLARPITSADLNSKPPRITARLEKYLEKTPLTGDAQFSHYRPARYLAENAGKLTMKIPKVTLDRFEAAFKALNSLLAK
jgi:predicted ATP-dependent endonuclease of OLD family